MPRRYFITGTDTDVGKSLVTAGLFRAALRRGLATHVVKPVQSGCIRAADGGLTAPDAVLYRQFQGDYPHGHIDVFAAFAPACSPHLAARLAGKDLTATALAARVLQSSAHSELTLVEGAGGLLVPLNDRETVLDLIRGIGFPVILVADNRLGVINHALLTLAVLRQHQLPVAGVVVNHCSPTTDDNRFIREDNPESIQQFSGIPVAGSIPFFADWAPDSEAFPQTMDRVFDPLLESVLHD